MSEQVSYQFTETSKSAELWRYIKFEQLFYLIETELLHFTFPEFFEDPFEGCYSKKTIDQMKAWQGSVGEHNRRMIHKANEIPIGVTCWHKQTSENWLMWKHYGADRGVAIVTEASSLFDSLCLPSSKPPIFGDIRYINLDVEDVQPLNILNRIMHKRLEFSSESETRVSFSTFDFEDEPKHTSAGFLVPASPKLWIKRIILSPELAFLFEPLLSYLSRHGYHDVLQYSDLCGSPYKLYETALIKAYFNSEEADLISIPNSIFIENSVRNE